MLCASVSGSCPRRLTIHKNDPMSGNCRSEWLEGRRTHELVKARDGRQVDYQIKWHFSVKHHSTTQQSEGRLQGSMSFSISLLSVSQTLSWLLFGRGDPSWRPSTRFVLRVGGEVAARLNYL